MELTRQIELWNDAGDYQKIIDALEALPQGERTAQLMSDLARAYNNLALPEDAHRFRRAVELLKPLEDELGDDHCWNFRLGYAYYYLDEEGPALSHFKRALEARPGDADTLEFIDNCRELLALPRFDVPFRQRTAAGWASFLEGEAGLRAMLDAKASGKALVARCTELLSPAFADVAFELGFSGEKYELILSPEGERAKLFALCYFARQVPAQLLDRWNVWVGRRPAPGFTLESLGRRLSAGDVQVWVTPPEKGQVSVALCCPALSDLLEADVGQVWWLLSLLLDQVLGEIAAMTLVDGFDVLAQPRTEPGLSLDRLPEVLGQMGLDLSGDPERLLERYTAYEMEPDRDGEADLRLDVFAGSSRCLSFLNEYLEEEAGLMDRFHRDGAVPGFLYYPTDCFSGPERGKAILDFRDGLEAAVLEKAGKDAVTFLGGASGLDCGYLDFIAWDLRAVLDAAGSILASLPVPWAAFHTFRRDVGGVSLKREEGPEESGSAGLDGAEDGQAQETRDAGCFTGFALLRQAHWDKARLIQDLREDWGLDASGDRDGEDLVFSVDGRMVAVSLMPAPVPNHEAEENAATNYLWPQAVDAAKAHQAHLVVAVLGQDAPLLERGKLFVQVMASCCKQAGVTGVYTSGTVFEPAYYEAYAGMLRDGALPVFNWIWFGLYRGERGACAYTYGMELFGKDEMEVLDADASPETLRDFLSNLAFYVLEGDVSLQDGETIGFSETQKLPISRGPGVSLPGVTLKIGYRA